MRYCRIPGLGDELFRPARVMPCLSGGYTKGRLVDALLATTLCFAANSTATNSIGNRTPKAL